MKNEKGPEGLPIEPTKLEFDPWEWAQGDDPTNNPGELLKSCGRQAEAVIKANKGNPELQSQALGLMNMVVGIFTAFDWKRADGTANDDAIRRSLVAMYMVGVESARLAITTKQDSVSVDEAINELKRQTLSDSARRAADARHSQPGGSRDRRDKIRAIWATGKYSSRTVCAEKECSNLGLSFDAARKALRNTPDPA